MKRKKNSKILESVTEVAEKCKVIPSFTNLIHSTVLLIRPKLYKRKLIFHYFQSYKF